LSNNLLTVIGATGTADWVGIVGVSNFVVAVSNAAEQTYIKNQDGTGTNLIVATDRAEALGHMGAGLTLTNASIDMGGTVTETNNNIYNACIIKGWGGEEIDCNGYLRNADGRTTLTWFSSTLAGTNVSLVWSSTKYLADRKRPASPVFTMDQPMEGIEIAEGPLWMNYPIYMGTYSSAGVLSNTNRIYGLAYGTNYTDACNVGQMVATGNVVLATATNAARTETTNLLEGGTVDAYFDTARRASTNEFALDEFATESRIQELLSGGAAVVLYGATNVHATITDAGSLFTEDPNGPRIFTNVLATGTNLIGCFYLTNEVTILTSGEYRGLFHAYKTGNGRVQTFIRVVLSNGSATNVLARSDSSDTITTVLLGYALRSAISTNITPPAGYFLGVEYNAIKTGVPATTLYTYVGDDSDSVWSAKLLTPALSDPVGATKAELYAATNALKTYTDTSIGVASNNAQNAATHTNHPWSVSGAIIDPTNDNHFVFFAGDGSGNPCVLTQFYVRATGTLTGMVELFQHAKAAIPPFTSTVDAGIVIDEDGTSDASFAGFATLTNGYWFRMRVHSLSAFVSTNTIEWEAMGYRP